MNPVPVANPPKTPPEPPALAHIEKTLAESYRKEIDQEENIWRSLPFFAATLALQLAALFQVIDRIPSGSSLLAILSMAAAYGAFAFSLVALGFLASSIFPAKFRYVAKDEALLVYALGLIEDERHPGNLAQPVPLVALHLLKENLAAQYALATDNNRQINKRRERRRGIAGLLTIFSVIMTLLLVVMALTTHVTRHSTEAVTNVRTPTVSSATSGAAENGVTQAPGAARAPAGLRAPPAPTDAGGH